MLTNQFGSANLRKISHPPKNLPKFYEIKKSYDTRKTFCGISCRFEKVIITLQSNQELPLGEEN